MTSQQRAEGIVNGQNFDCIMSRANSESLKRHIIEALDQSRKDGFEAGRDAPKIELIAELQKISRKEGFDEAVEKCAKHIGNMNFINNCWRDAIVNDLRNLKVKL